MLLPDPCQYGNTGYEEFRAGVQKSKISFIKDNFDENVIPKPSIFFCFTDKNWTYYPSYENFTTSNTTPANDLVNFILDSFLYFRIEDHVENHRS